MENCSNLKHTWLAPRNYLNQCRLIINETLSNKLQWNLNQNNENKKIIIQETALNMSPAECKPFRCGHMGHHWLIQLMACNLFHTKPLSEPMLTYFQWGFQEQTSEKFESNTTFSFKKMDLRMSSAERWPFFTQYVSTMTEMLGTSCWPRN